MCCNVLQCVLYLRCAEHIKMRPVYQKVALKHQTKPLSYYILLLVCERAEG